MEAQMEFDFTSSTHGLNISKELKKKIIAFINKNQPTVYWDRSDALSTTQIEMILAGKSDEVESELYERNIDYVCNLENELIESLQDKFPELIDFKMEDLREEFIDYIGVDFNFKSLVNNTPAVVLRVTLHSNYEGVNYADRGKGDFKDSDYMRQLKGFLRKRYDEKSFQVELDNIMSCVNQFIFLLRVEPSDLLDVSPEWKTLTIPKEAWCGFFDSWNGSGSVLEVKLSKDITVKKQWGKTEHDMVTVVVDEASKYSVDETYGLCGYPKGKLTFK